MARADFYVATSMSLRLWRGRLSLTEALSPHIHAWMTGLCCHCQGVEYCQGACRLMNDGRPCFHCHDPDPEANGASACAFAMDLGNAQCALLPMSSNGKDVLEMKRGACEQRTVECVLSR